jgi:hypothetical protein
MQITGKRLIDGPFGPIGVANAIANHGNLASLSIFHLQ